MTNPNCVCPVAGFCNRHKIDKSEHLHSMCKGVAPTVDCGRKYWIAWEQGMLSATAPPDPVTNPPSFCPEGYELPLRSATVTAQPAGLGDVVTSALSAIGITEARVNAWLGGECGCAARRAKLNRLGTWASSFLTGSPTEKIDQMLEEKG